MMEIHVNGIHVDKEQTSSYRDLYNDPCECDACQFFRDNFATQYPEVVTYLQEFGIDTNYPLEVMDFSNDEEKTFHHYIVYYCVKGKLPVDKMNEKIGDVDLTLRNWTIADEAYAQTGMEPPYFIIELDIRK